jgi:carboxymethylenebutenolidase
LRIGVVGLSMGGTFALTQACHNSDLKAAVSFYGKVPPVETFRFLLSPVLYHYPERDAWVTKQEVELLKQAREKYGKTIDVAVYPEAQHGFCNETRSQVYRADDARSAWNRTLEFLRRYV